MLSVFRLNLNSYLLVVHVNVNLGNFDRPLTAGNEWCVSRDQSVCVTCHLFTNISRR
jgi:hypothetical protein